MAMKDMAVIMYPQYQVFQNGEWQWVNAPYIGPEHAGVVLPGYDPEFWAQVHEMPNSALSRPVRLVGGHSSHPDNWLIKVSLGHPTWDEYTVVLDGQGHFTQAIPSGSLPPSSFIYAYLSFVEKDPPPMSPPIGRFGVIRLNSREF